MFIYVYLCTCICICICMYKYIYIYIHISIYAYIHLYVYMYINIISINVYIFIYIHLYTRTFMCYNVFLYTHTTGYSPHVCMFLQTDTNRLIHKHMGWLRLVGSFKLQVSFAKEPCKRDDILQKRPVILRCLLIEATTYTDTHTQSHANWFTCHTTACFYTDRQTDTHTQTHNTRTHAHAHTNTHTHTHTPTHNSVYTPHGRIFVQTDRH